MANRNSGALVLQLAYPLVALVLVIVVVGGARRSVRYSALCACRRQCRSGSTSRKTGWRCWPGSAQPFSSSSSASSSAPAAGFIFAVIMDASRSARGVLYPILITSQAIPVVAISAALTIWLGFGLAPKLVIVALVVFFPVVVNVLDGLASVDRDLLNLVRSMGASKLQHLPACQVAGDLFTTLFGTQALRDLRRHWRGHCRVDRVHQRRTRRLSAAGQFTSQHCRHVLGHRLPGLARRREFPARRAFRVSPDPLEIVVEGADLVAKLLARRAS